MVELTRSNSHFGSTSFKTRTLCQPRKECGTRKGSFHGEREGKSLQRQLPQWYHPHSSWVKKQKMCCDAKGWATRLAFIPVTSRPTKLIHLRPGPWRRGV